MTVRFPFTCYLARGEEEIVVRGAYEVRPGCPERRYGDYPQPAEPDEVEVLSVTTDPPTVTLTEAEHERIEDYCAERAAEDWADYLFDAYERRAEMRADLTED